MRLAKPPFCCFLPTHSDPGFRNVAVEINRDGANVLLRLANGPVNALSIGAGLVPALAGEMAAANADPACPAIVVAGAGKMFCGGADITDFDSDPASVGQLRDLVNLNVSSPKPVIMAIHAVARGGGFELALAGHYRFAHAQTRGSACPRSR